WIPEDRRRHIPVDGWAGEPAVDRFERLAVEGGIPYRLVLPVLASDRFDRTVPVGWGTADLGGEGQTFGNTFSVSAGEGVISTSVGGHAHLSGVTVTDVDMRASVMASDQHAASSLNVRDGPDYTYTVELWQSGGTVSVDIWRLLDGQWEELASFVLGDDIDPGQRWWIRAQVRGDRIRGKAWVVGEPEPDWQVEAHDGAIPSGLVGVTSESLAGGRVTFRWRDITVSATPNHPCGVPQRAKLLDLLQDAADVDGGILHETRDEPGYTLRTLTSLFNQEPAVTLDAAASGGEMTAPFAPVLDDQHRLNDATAKRPEGGAARVVDAEHAGRHGRSAGEVQVRVAHDRQLPSYA